ncbi:MAG: glycosyltransferase [Pirellulales bacterium]|nr:glycosyltransferase [Pirellulales bacterium]
MPESGKLRVLMATPVPPPLGGGILNWTRIVMNYLGEIPDLELRIIDTKLRFRSAMSLNRAQRLVSGTLQSLVDSYRLMKAMKSFRPHVFHLCTSGGMATPRDTLMLRIARLFGVPGVIHYHMGRLPWIFIRQGLLWNLTRRAMSLADAVVTLDRLSAITIRPELSNTRVVTLPNSVEIDELDAIRPLGEDLRPEENVRRIVYLGMVLPSKGILELVQACLKLQGRHIELELVGAVGKAFREELTALASQRGSGEWLRFTGMVGHDRAMEHLAAADILALPSHTEGAPNVILEAMAMERCVVATAVGAIPEMLDLDGPEECGLCVPPRDVESLAEALATALDDPERMHEMGMRGRARAKRLYDAPVACRQLVNLWEDAAAAHKAKYFRKDRPTTVVIVAPLPPPDHGGIVNWSRILREAFAESPSWRLHFVDNTARYRKVTNLSLPVRLIGGTFQAMKTWLTINKSIYRIRPQVVHICTSGGLATPRNIVTLKIARHYGIPSVIHYRMGAIPKACAKNGMEWRWMLRAMRLADVVITLDRHSEACVRKCLPGKRVVSLPNMVDLDEIDGIRSKLDPLAEQAEDFRVVFTGHVLPTKGIGELVEACAKLAGRGVQLHLVGPVEEKFRAKLLDSAAAAGTVDWLHFHGPQPHGEAVRIAALADVAVLPSYTEGFPNAVLEAMALGKAILATNVGAIPEMLDIGGAEECGICVAPREMEPLLGALERLMENPELRRELGEKARRRAQRLYSVPAGCKHLIDLWSSVDARDCPPQ